MAVNVTHEVDIDIGIEEAGIDVHVINDKQGRVEIIGDGWSLRIPSALALRIGAVGGES